MAATAGVIQTGSVPLYIEQQWSMGPSLLLVPGGGADGGVVQPDVRTAVRALLGHYL